LQQSGALVFLYLSHDAIHISRSYNYKC